MTLADDTSVSGNPGPSGGSGTVEVSRMGSLDLRERSEQVTLPLHLLSNQRSPRETHGLRQMRTFRLGAGTVVLAPLT